jgi:hypothetical protein
MDWRDFILDREQWRPLVDTEINIRLPQILGNSPAAERLAASPDGLSSMDLFIYLLQYMIENLFSRGSFLGMIVMTSQGVGGGCRKMKRYGTK